MKRMMLCIGLALLTCSCASSLRQYDDGATESHSLEEPQQDMDSGDFKRGALRTGGMLSEARLEPADMRIQRNGVIHVNSGDELEASTRLRRQSPSFEAIVMSFDTSSVTFKMPSSRIESLIDVIENEQSWQIDELDFTAWDRTGEYFSVEARIETQTAIKARLSALLESAGTVEDVLKIGGKIDEVQIKIDSLKTSLRDIKLHAGRVDVTIRFD